MNATTSLASSLICLPQKVCHSVLAGGSDRTPATDATEFHTGMHARLAGLEQTLAKHRLLALPDANARLICLAGMLWLTRHGDIEDYILGPGQGFVVRRGDQAVVQALQPSRLRLVAA